MARHPLAEVFGFPVGNMASDGVRDLAGRYGFDTRTIAMKNTHHAKMCELLIGRDLGWMDEA